MPDLSHFIQDKLKKIYLEQVQMCKVNNSVNDILINFEFTYCIENSVDPDQLASSDTS